VQIGGISIPGLKTRRASTTLELRDGESFAIAGLLQKDFKTTVDQVPLLVAGLS
jgi:pilus assembly protein CpaC